MKACKTCKWWDIESAQDKAGRVRKDRVAKCLYPVESIAIPEACFSSWKGRHPLTLNRHMGPARGADCQTWEEKDNE